MIHWTQAPEDRDPGTYTGGCRYLVDGKIHDWKGPSKTILSPVFQTVNGQLQRRTLGQIAMVDSAVASQAVEAASLAFDRGRGPWPNASITTRLQAMTKFLDKMEKSRLEVAKLLCWEIGKPWADSLLEFDRTVEYGRATVEALKTVDRQMSGFLRDGGFIGQARRAPYGVALCMGPFNYPINETFATLLPAIIMGNSVVVKLPRMGLLCNMPLLEAFAESFPPGVVNIISGQGSSIVKPIMGSGLVNLLAFIGSAGVVNQIRSMHPKPNRLRSVLGLGAKNPAIIFPDADLTAAAGECVSGALSFNGQRCTALKIIFVHRSIADDFVERVVKLVSGLKAGMPFEDKVTLTPLPEEAVVQRMTHLTQDAVTKGARVANAGGGEIDRTYFSPAVVYPIKPGMALWDEEQFGPIVPIAVFDKADEIIDYLADGDYGQQASVFAKTPEVIGPFLDALVNQVCRVNLNTQCRRGPDTFPFGGRKDSAEATLSIADALRVFSIRAVAVGKDDETTHEVMRSIILKRTSGFLKTDYLF